MNDKIFLIDNNTKYSYQRIINDILGERYLYNNFTINSLYDFFKNFIKAIISNNDILLDNSKNDMISNKNINDTKIYIKTTCEPDAKFGLLIEKFKKSRSKITVFTSGTTGQPKRVIHSISSLTRDIRIAEKYKNNIWAYTYDPIHMAGIQVFLQAFMNKNTIINVFNKNRDYVYEQIEKYKITHISATPTFYRLLLPYNKKYTTIKRVTFGGERSGDKLYSRIKEIFPNAKVNNIYASTEAGTIFISNGEFFKIPSKFRDKIIVNNNEILLHKSLLGDSEELFFNNDYYRTGDIIEWYDREQTLFKFKNRINELINVGGYKVNPVEVENTIMQTSNIIQQVKVYGKKNSVIGNILCADIKLVSGYENSISEKDLKRSLNLFLEHFKIPRIIKFVDSLQLTQTGKLKRT